VFDGSKDGIGFAQITDGTSKTIALVEADADQVVDWTRPNDWEFDAKNPKAGIGKLRPGGCNAAWADGSVRFLSNGIDPQMLKALMTRNGREVVDRVD
jgi:prepilin-type processing-associated H-X9-DG protein